ISRFLEYDANKISLVFSYRSDYHESNKETYLLTGDADKSVFNRLIKTKPQILKADVLKVPHHGSKHNLNKKIVKHVSPKIAIISHGNGKFGKATDPHPNREVIKILTNCGVATYYTNDVIKKGGTICLGYKGKINGTNVSII
ncbi:MAG: ComEC/Rec2 family competence protein, partial [Sulfuriferula sp.]